MCQQCNQIKLGGAVDDNDYDGINEKMLSLPGVMAVETHPGKEYITLSGDAALTILSAYTQTYLSLSCTLAWMFVPKRTKQALEDVCTMQRKYLDIVA